jgi:hypothetical protein
MSASEASGELRMSKNNESLILEEKAKSDEAPFLFSEDDLPKVDKAKPKFHCSGERLPRERPDVYKAVEPGVSIRTICRESHASDHTIRSVGAREEISIPARKKEVLSNIRHGLRLATEPVIETRPEASTRDALISVGILAEKDALLSGSPTIGVEIGQSISIPEQIQRLVDEVREKIKQAKARQIDLGGEQTEQKALMNADGKHSCAAENGAGNAVIDVNSPLLADHLGSEAGNAI